MIHNLINIQDANTIINSFPNREFYSHEFIEEFNRLHHQEYEALRARYLTDADRKAHSLIARFLLARAGKGLNIDKVRRGRHINKHGNLTSCALWERR